MVAGTAASQVIINYSSDTDGQDVEFNLPVPTGVYNKFTLEIKAKKRENLTSLYSTLPPKKVDATLKMIPYNSFANRGESDMLVWVNANY